MSRTLRSLVSFVALLSAAATVPAAQSSPAPQLYAVIYSRGSAWTSDAAAFAHPALKEHVRHFEALGDRLVGAAPFALDAAEPTVGMVLMLSESADAARAWASADPSVTAQVMTTKVLRWRVSALRPYKATP